MGEEDREGRDHGVKCVLGGPEGSWELWKKEGIEQAGPRVSRASRCGSSRDGREFAQESRLQHPQHSRVARE